MIWKSWAENVGAKTLSVVFAVVLWFMVTNDIEFEKELEFPIEYQGLPSGITPVNELPKSVRALVRGNGKFLAFKLRDGICKVDLTETEPGLSNILLTGGHLKLPAEAPVRTREILEPRRIRTEFDEVISRDIDVRAAIAGEPDEGYLRVGKTFVNPAVAEVRGPRKLVEALERVLTEEIDLDDGRTNVRERVRLVRPGPETIEVTPMTVEIGITIEPIDTQTMENVILEFVDLPNSSAGVFQPGLMQVEVRGAKGIVAAATSEVSSVLFKTKSWKRGASIMRFKEIRGRDIVFAPHDTFPLVTMPPWGPADAPPPMGPVAAPGEDVPDAVEGEMIASLPLPPEVEVLSVQPDRIVVKVRKKEQGKELVHTPDPSP